MHLPKHQATPDQDTESQDTLELHVVEVKSQPLNQTFKGKVGDPTGGPAEGARGLKKL